MRTIKNSLLTSLLMLLPACSLSFKPDVKEINSIKEVAAIFEQASQEDLFVFDVDEVLLEPVDPAMQQRYRANPEFEKITYSFYVGFMEKQPQEYKDIFFSKLYLKKKYQPVEKALIDNILALQKRNVKVIALTALPIGKYGLIERLEEWRYQNLLTLGLDFGRSFEQQNISFDELLKSEYAAQLKAKKGKDPRPAGFYKGIACAGRFSKGVVLKLFLERIGWKPARIFYFDDQHSNAESVTQEIKSLGIQCQAFVYNAAIVGLPINDIDIEVARLQHELMKIRNDYVSYLEAKKILEEQRRPNKDNVRPIQTTP